MSTTLNGKWEGEYVYGSGYEESLVGKRVLFEMFLEEEDGLIRGSCSDSETRHIFNTPATIEGSFEHGAIVFYKTYPCFYEFDEYGMAVISDTDTPPSIEYKGVLKKKIFSKRTYFDGTWEINGSFVDAEGNAQYYSCNGTWSMERR